MFHEEMNSQIMLSPRQLFRPWLKVPVIKPLHFDCYCLKSYEPVRHLRCISIIFVGGNHAIT